MALGDSFPAEFRAQKIEQQLVPGAVLYLPFLFPGAPKTKEKFLVVVAALEPKLLLMVINTEVHQFIADSPDLRRCNVIIDQLEHPFLSYDSNLACHKVEVIDSAVIATQIKSDVSRYKGHISNGLKQKICQVLATQPKTINKKYRDAIEAALRAGS